MKLGFIEALALERQRILKYLARRVGSRETAEEILHSAYLKALQSSKSLRCEEHATAWFHRIVRNATADHFRRLRREKGALESYRRESERAGPQALASQPTAPGCGLTAPVVRSAASWCASAARARSADASNARAAEPVGAVRSAGRCNAQDVPASLWRGGGGH